MNPVYQWRISELFVCEKDIIQYRTISGDPYCNGFDKYEDVYSQVSIDSGATWETTATTPTLVEHNSRDCGYVPPYSDQYLTFTSRNDGNSFSFVYTGGSFFIVYYSIDDGETWTELKRDGSNSTPIINKGQTVTFKGNMGSSLTYGNGHFTSHHTFDVSGNIMSLVYGDNFSGQTELVDKYGLMHGVFKELFKYSSVVSAENLILPTETLPLRCYYTMFLGCASLTKAPTLSSTTIGDECYLGMFKGCTSLTEAPNLPATTLKSYCYQEMFAGCTSLTTAPVLSAATLAKYCYRNMFDGCTNLSSITCLATDISANGCTNKWVYEVAPRGTFIKAASMTSWGAGNSGIPKNWTVVNYRG